MLRTTRAFLAAAFVIALAALVAGGAQAQSKGKIICWKDKSGKVVGCGDTVPPEYQGSGTKELDKRGVMRGTTESAEDTAKRALQTKETERQKAEEKKRLEEQKRQDAALLNTFTDEKEIDLKRDRDLQVVNTQISQLRIAHKNAVDRLQDFKGRIQTAEKDKKPPSEYYKEEVARAEADKAKVEQGIAAKEKEKEDIRKRYADMRERYIFLRGGASPAPTAAAAPAAAKK